MPSSTISIRVNGQWNGSQIENAIKDLTRLGDSSKKFGSLYTSSMQRLAVLAASTDKSVSRSLANASTQLVNAGNNLQEFGRKAQEVGSKLTTHLTIPLVGIGTYAGAMAVRYDTAMANVRKVSDMTEAELEALADSALELSTIQPVSAEEILNIEALGSQLGVADEKLEEFAMTIAGLDIATNLNADEAATQLARFANITGMSEDEYENFGSTIVAIGNNMATTESEVSNMAMRLAAAGDIAGMSEAEILGMAGAMSSLGIRAEAGGSAMTTIMSKISKAVASGGDDIEAFASVAGMSADEFAASWKKDPMDAIIALLDGIHNLDEQGLQDMNVTLGELGINEIRQSDAMRRLANDTDVLKDAVNLATNAWDENTALSDEVTQRNESMASKLQILKNRVDEIAINVGGPLVSALIDVLGAADPLIQAISGMAQAFADADEGTQQMILGLVAVAAGAGPAISVFGKFTEGVGKVKSALGHFGQDVATFQDSMTTVDGAMMRVYNSTDTLATNMGIARNKMAEVAGGADNYVKVWEEAYDAQNRYNKLSERYANLEQAAASATGNSAESIKRKMDATKAEMDVAKQAYNTN